MRLVLLLALLLAGDPWSEKDLVQPPEVAARVQGPLIIQVGVNVQFRAAHIPGSRYAGPASRAEGIELLRAAVSGQPMDRNIILYCGCCPWDKCPNIRPAFTALHDMGYTRVRVMMLPKDFKTDWDDKGYPTTKRTTE